MTPPVLSRGPVAAAEGHASAPRLLHLGLGNFFRAHQCFYTDQAADGQQWPIAAFTGTHPGNSALVGDLQSQDGLFTLVERQRETDRLHIVRSLARAHAAGDNEAWLAYWRSSALCAVTLTITEAGYLRSPTGGLDLSGSAVRGDLVALREDPTGTLRTAPGRLLAGLIARHRADAGPVALVPCDNIGGNGALLRRMLMELAELADPLMARWVMNSVTVVDTMVDRITPRVTAADIAALAQSTAYSDRCPVITEPFSEWVLSGDFPTGRPRWESAGATFTDDVTPHENRKLWLLNGAHSLLAYAGLLRGHDTVSEAAADEQCLSWVMEWWAVASTQLDQPENELESYCHALQERFANERMRDRLDRIAVDGSQKLPVRIVTVLRSERASGRLPVGAIRVLAAWICHVRGMGGPVNDVQEEKIRELTSGPLATAVAELLNLLAQGLGDDGEVVAIAIQQCQEFDVGRRD